VSQGLRQSIRAGRFTKSGSFKARVYDAEFPSAFAQTTIDVKGLVRTDCAVTDDTKCLYTLWARRAGLWPHESEPQPYSDTKTFTLTYEAGTNDDCDGTWKHDYFLESQGGQTMILENQAWNPVYKGGAAVAVAWTVEIDGQKEWEVTLGGDCRGGSSDGGSITVPVGPVNVNVPLSFNASKVSVAQSFAKLFKIPVQKSSPEGQNLSHPVEVTIRANAVVEWPWPKLWTWKAKFDGGDIKWKKSKVLSSHFSPLPCSQR
ncbi:MAG: hypothetical protein KGZ25_05970, partial [Planctomycetes bacterium]|nr:hypothetical protein [Planctomycetota bacterium]